MTAIVYFGPSIEARRVAEIVSAAHAAPIKRGDLQRVHEHQIVVILDGEFGQNLSVSPKEILTLLDNGKTVIGAASMGALRACELDRFGMIGVGWVYERFKRAPVRRDDDVALIYSPLDGRSVTIPMVDVEFWVERLIRSDLLTSHEGVRICRAARKIFFGDRTQDTLLARIGDLIGDGRLRTLLAYSGNAMPDIKRQDSEAALQLAAHFLQS